MSLEIPKVTVLNPISPAPHSVDATTLQYDNLFPAVAENSEFESARIDHFWDTDHDTIEELAAGRQLAMQYLLMSSAALNRTVNFSPSAALWSERYTEASVGLYGAPDPDIAKALWHKRESGDRSGEIAFKETASILGNYLEKKYHSVYDDMDLESSKNMISPSGIADKFETGLSVLAKEFDPAWDEYRVIRDQKKHTISFFAPKQIIKVGMLRVDAEPRKVKGLFTHEVLTHALRSIRGKEISDYMAKGLPGHIDAEEGLAVFSEYALSGEIEDSISDLYMDIGFALGQIDGRMHTRADLTERTLQRKTKRNEVKEVKKTPQVLETETTTHVNRIYRGSKGDDSIAVFTKDICYYEGFIKMGTYITDQLAAGTTIEEIMDYVTIGKFDPTDPRHQEYVRSHQGVDVEKY